MRGRYPRVKAVKKESRYSRLKGVKRPSKAVQAINITSVAFVTDLIGVPIFTSADV